MNPEWGTPRAPQVIASSVEANMDDRRIGARRVGVHVAMLCDQPLPAPVGRGMLTASIRERRP